MIHVEKKILKTIVGDIDLITLKSPTMEVALTSFGAAVYYIKVLNHLVSVGPQNMDHFLQSLVYYGKTVGRTSGRLILPSFKIDNKVYPIKPFKGDNVKLHGGPTGFSFRHFKTVSSVSGETEGSVSFAYTSQHMEEEYPGKMNVLITYHLTNEMGLKIIFEADSDQDTICNLTNHTYFNLSTAKPHIFDHDITIHADHYLDIDKDVIVRAKKAVKGTPFDFNQKTNLGRRMQQMKDTPFMGFDHTWILKNQITKVEVDEVSSPVKLQVETSYPAVVIYTHNYPSPVTIEQFNTNGIHSSFTLECQYEPGGIHYPFLNQAILRKNEHYKHFILYQFVKK